MTSSDGPISQKEEQGTIVSDEKGRETVRILYIEDDAGLAGLLKRRLLRCGYTVDIAPDGQTGLAMLAADKYDILLVDYDLPICGGLEVIRRLVVSDQLIPAIMVTGNGSEKVAVEAIKLGATDYVIKDVDMTYIELLPVIIEQALQRQELIRLKDRADAALRVAYDEMESRVRMRTADLARTNNALEEEIRERQLVAERLKASLHEKEILLMEIHHRVKNNLQIIASLLNLQSTQTSNSELTGLLLESQNRIESMALIHERLYSSRDLARINFSDYIEELTEHLVHTYGIDQKKIVVTKQVEDVSLGIDSAVPCGLIINELLTNSLKHAFGRGSPGQILVSFLRKADGSFLLKVRDSGRDFPPDLNCHDPNTLGLRLVHSLTKQLDGDIEIGTEGGTEVRICFRESPSRR